ncbi:hypothetical protein [Alkaliphilus pronyensis]|nr:hypothetical protein [Alkaliphilus pronyensis]
MVKKLTFVILFIFLLTFSHFNKAFYHAASEDIPRIYSIEVFA